ncbi:MAG: hypothetical protein IPM16_06760 [Chloroflexi bacterium]|nr:hypothetical protein [Chloroflexota bacterium]
MPATEIQDVVSDRSYYLWTPTGESGLTLAEYVQDFDWGSDSNTEMNTSAAFLLETEQYIRGKIAPKMTLAYRDSVGGAAVREALLEKTKGILIEGPEGNAAGKPKYGAMLQVKKANAPRKLGKLLVITIEFVNIGSDWVYHPSYGDTF